MSAEKAQHIDVMIIDGQDGVVHVRTPENMEDTIVDSQFESITEGLGMVATADVEIDEPPIETKTDAQNRELGKGNSWFSGPPARPSKVKK